MLGELLDDGLVEGTTRQLCWNHYDPDAWYELKNGAVAVRSARIGPVLLEQLVTCETPSRGDRRTFESPSVV